MLSVLMTAAISFMLSFLAIPVIIRVADEKKLFDLPDARKLHKKPIASLGGVGVFIGFFLAVLLSISGKANPEFQFFYAAFVIIFFLGLKDDILILTATKKFIGQVGAAALIIHLGGIRIESMHGLFGLYQLPEIFSLALSYITIILIINAFNLIDGVDGLAGTLGLLTTCVFGAYFYMADMPSFALLAFSMSGSLLAFLIFNHHPAKIFLGDSGSLLLGLVNSILVIKFITVADERAVAIPLQSSVAIGISILMVPLMDTLRVFSIRIFNGRSPFSPDRNHIHHLLLDSGLFHQHVTFCCLLLNILFITVAYFGRSLGPTFVLFSITAISFVALAIIIYFRKKKLALQAMENALEANNAIPAGDKNLTKIVSINTDEIIAAEN